MKKSRKILALVMILCLTIPLFGVPAAAASANDLPIDFQFEEVKESEVPMNAEKLSFDAFSSLQWDMKMIGMQQAWDSGLTGKGVRVAVIDSGISNLTADIPSGRITKGKNLSDASGLFGSTVVDMEGHGTFIAGIIGAARGNGIGIAGVAPDVQFVSIKTLSREAEAIRVAVDEYGANVINMSMGTPYDNAALREAVQYATSKGVIIVAAIGNDGTAQLEYPAAYSEVIGVGAVDKNSNVCSFSNKNDSVFVVAPGEKVLSLGPAPLLVYRSSGTSFSAPFVTGVAALLKQAHPEMTAADFQKILQASSKDLGDSGYDTASGWGLLQAPEAIKAADEYFSAEAQNTDAGKPIDHQYEAVSEKEVSTNAQKLSFDAFSSLQWDMKMIGMEQAWNSGLTGKGVTVGIVDSGLSNLTMDIDRSRILEGVNLSPVKLNFGSPVMDTEGHGTFIAGIIGATKGNGIGIAGVAPEVTFAPIKCFGTLFSTPDAVISGIYAAVDQYHCDVINLSSGMTSDLPRMKQAIDYAISKGAIVISTVGNDGDATYNYPGAYNNVIAVGSVDKNMKVSEFSNQNDSVFVVAPGEKVLSLGTLPFTVYRSSGTSFSAPFVVGVAALLKQAHPEMNQADFMEILKNSAKDLGDNGYDTSYGYGLLDAPAAIKAADAHFTKTDAAQPEQPAEVEFNVDDSLPLDQQLVDVNLGQVPQNAEKLSFDPFSPLQWDMKMVGMREGWKSGLTGSGVRVGIIDSGVSLNTGDIDSSRLLPGKNLVNASENTDDTNGHGTFIAGIIGATKGNGVGIAGVAPNVTIVPLKTSNDGKSDTGINSRAIYAAVDEYHCDVINISIGSVRGTETLHNAIKYAESKGVIIVCSTGNDGSETIHYPGGYEETIGVGFVNIAQKTTSFSHHNETIDVVAPGFGVVSLSCKVPYIAKLGAGSSYAAPFVSGLAALLKEKYPDMNKTDFLEILKMSSKDLGDKGYDTYYGWGLIQVPEAIRAADAYFSNAQTSDNEKLPAVSSLIERFRDVLKNSWFYSVIQYVTEKGYMKGVDSSSFEPQSLVTRAQIAQILYNIAGKPEFTPAGSFSDVSSSAWYYAPVMWAEQAGLVNGYPEGAFGPNDPATREQMAAILQRFAQWKGLSANAGSAKTASFQDSSLISDWAKGAMHWATSLGVMNGDNLGRLNPLGFATRAEVASMLKNFDLSVK